MKVLHDHLGLAIRLTDERLAHIHEHPEMAGLDAAIEETLARPQFVVQSASDQQANLYYRYYMGTMVGDKYLCVSSRYCLRMPSYLRHILRIR